MIGEPVGRLILRFKPPLKADLKKILKILDMDSKRFFLKLLKSYICREHVSYDDNADWNKILRLAEIHSVQAILFIAVNRLEKKPPIYDQLRKYGFSAMQTAALQEIGVREIIKAFHENQIEHTFVKGYVLRNYYPDKKVRSMGDIDILINVYDREKCHNVMLALGFHYEEADYNQYVWSYEKGVLHVEVHTALVYENLFHDYDYISYFREKVRNRKNIGGSTYALSVEDHFIFLMVHIARHFYNAGIGVRMILDIVVYLQTFGRTMDISYIKNELKRIQLGDFSNIIFYICKKYFNSEIDCVPVPEDDLDLIMDYIISHGVFGYYEKDYMGIRYKRDGKRGPRLLLEKIFPSAEFLSKNYPWFRSGKKYMLPYAWIRRWIYNLTNESKRSKIKNKLSSVLNDDDDVIHHMKILKTAGLK